MQLQLGILSGYYQENQVNGFGSRFKRFEFTIKCLCIDFLFVNRFIVSTIYLQDDNLQNKMLHRD